MKMNMRSLIRKHLSAVVGLLCLFGWTATSALCQPIRVIPCGDSSGLNRSDSPAVELTYMPAEHLILLRQGSSVLRLRVVSDDQIEKACLTSTANLLLVTHTAQSDRYTLRILTPSLGKVDVIFDAGLPSISPDGRWLIRREWTPPGAPGAVSDEYLLYDLSKTPKENRGSDDSKQLAYHMPGRLVYPKTKEDRPFINVDVPPENAHEFRANSFSWDQESRTAAFADWLNGVLSVVIVVIEGDSAKTFIRPIRSEEVCGQGDGDLLYVKAGRILFGPAASAARTISIDFAPMSAVLPSCGLSSKVLDISLTEFRPALEEIYEEPLARMIRTQRRGDK